MSVQPTKAHFGETELPDRQHHALRRARRLQWVGMAYLLTCVLVVYLVMGSSQAMKVAWIEDLLSLIPPIVFLIAARRAALPPSIAQPYGHHRSVGSAHLAAAVALFAMGLFLVIDSALGLIRSEHPPINSVQIFGHTFWAGWLMIAAMVYTGVGPVILGHLKMPLAEDLHDKVLLADADMNKADWMTAGAAIVGILGIGFGLWWADGVAAIVIAGSILKDGLDQIRGAARDLMDGEARTHDDTDVHPLVDEVLTVCRERPWVSRVGIRVRDQGHVLHTEIFVVPLGEATLDQCAELTGAVQALDWKLGDVVVIPVRELPTGARTAPRGLE